MTETTLLQRTCIASDLSAWCDRALARAALRALARQSELTRGPVANASWRTAVTQQCVSHLAAAALPARIEAALHRVLEQGTAQTLLCDTVASADVDVVVLGSQGRSRLGRAPLGSTAESLLLPEPDSLLEETR